MATQRTLAQPPATRAHKLRPWLEASAAAVVLLLITGAWLGGKYWPFRYREVRPLMEEVFGSQVTVERYHRVYFPHPGFMATKLTLRRKSAPGQPPVGSVDSILVEGAWGDLLTLHRRVRLVSMTGVHLVIPAPGSAASKEDFPPGSTTDFTGPDTLVERLEVHNSMLDVLRANGQRYSFPVHMLLIQNMQKGRTMLFAVDMDNALPRGHIRATGKFGPLNGSQLGATIVSGNFLFDRVNLSDVGDIGGTLNAQGRFVGPLSQLEAEAQTDTPDFNANDGTPTHVTGSVRCVVNGLNGEVSFHAMDARIADRGAGTAIHAEGDVRGSPKETNLDIVVNRGRAEDLLRPFLRNDPPIAGPVQLHAHVRFAPSGNGAGFFERLRVDGVFDVPAQRVTNAKVENSLTSFSERAQGKQDKNSRESNGADAEENPNADAISSLKGPAAIRDAIVSTHGLTFQVAGAQSRLDGTFNLHTSEVHLTGDLVMQSDISHAATGFKSLLLKPLAPFFKKKKAGAVVPIAVIGKPGHYQVVENITHSK